LTEQQYFDWLTEGGSNDVLRMIAVLDHVQARWCMIGGLAVNHWAQEPLVTRDVDIVVALDQVEPAIPSFESAGFLVKRFPWSINLDGHSQISIQISTDEMYREFPGRSVPADIHGIPMRVACLEDTMTGKLAAYADKGRRPSKRQKDLADIARLIESHPGLEKRVPASILERIRD
jgi:hypothetical protein